MLRLPADTDGHLHSARLSAVLAMGHPGPTVLSFQLTARGSQGLGFGVAPVSSCADLQRRGNQVPGASQSWPQGLCLGSSRGFYHNNSGRRVIDGLQMSAGDRVELWVDRSDAEDPLGGTVGFTVNGAPVALGKEGQPTVALGFAEDAYVVVSLQSSEDIVQVVE